MKQPSLVKERDEGGFSIIEVLMSLTFLAAGALTLMSVMATTSENDEANRDRSIALKAAMTQMENVLAYDDNNDIDDFIANWTMTANQTFTVDSLKSPDVAGDPAPGTVTIDATDTERVSITISVRWMTRKGATRQISLPFTKTETLE